MEIKTFIRKRFLLDGVQVTPENIPDVAEWCDGDVKVSQKGMTFIKVNATNPPSPRHTKAYVGDWVLRSGGTEQHPEITFKVYTSRSLDSSFDPFERDLIRIDGTHFEDDLNVAQIKEGVSFAPQLKL